MEDRIKELENYLLKIHDYLDDKEYHFNDGDYAFRTMKEDELFEQLEILLYANTGKFCNLN